MASSSGRKYGSSGRSGPRKRVVIGADETVRVRYQDNEPHVEAQRRSTSRESAKVGSKRLGPERTAASRHGQRISAAKREEREHRQRVIRVRRWGLLVLAAAAVIGIVWGFAAILRAPVFTIENVEVVGGSHLQRAQILEAAAIPADATLLRVPSSAIVRRLKSNAWVADARVSRDFPSTLRIEITERRPVAVVDAGGTNLWVVSTDGYWLGKRSAEESSVVVIRDVEGVRPVAGAKVATKELLNAVRVATGISPELTAMTRAISAPTVDKTALITTDDIEIYIGEASQLGAKDRVAREILQREKGKVVYINVRVVERPTWRGLEDSE